MCAQMPERRVDADALRAEVDRFRQHLLREDLVLDDALVVIEVVDEQVQRLHALLQPKPRLAPLLFRDHSRDHVEGPGAVDRPALLRIDGEGDAHLLDGDLGRKLARMSSAPPKD
jgi:hypothetical protein